MNRKKYQLHKLSDAGLDAVHNSAYNLLFVLSTHHHDMALTPNTEVFYLSTIIGDLKDMIDECIDERKKRISARPDSAAVPETQYF